MNRPFSGLKRVISNYERQLPKPEDTNYVTSTFSLKHAEYIASQYVGGLVRVCGTGFAVYAPKLEVEDGVRMFVREGE